MTSAPSPTPLPSSAVLSDRNGQPVAQLRVQRHYPHARLPGIVTWRGRAFVLGDDRESYVEVSESPYVSIEPLGVRPPLRPLGR